MELKEIITKHLERLAADEKRKAEVNSRRKEREWCRATVENHQVFHHGPVKGEEWKSGFNELRKILAEMTPSERTRKIVAEHTGPDGYITLYRGCSKYEARKIKENLGYYPAGLFWSPAQAHAATYARRGRVVRVEIPAVFIKQAHIWPTGGIELNFNLVEAAPYARNLQILQQSSLLERLKSACRKFGIKL